MLKITTSAHMYAAHPAGGLFATGIDFFFGGPPACPSTRQASNLAWANLTLTPKLKSSPHYQKAWSPWSC